MASSCPRGGLHLILKKKFLHLKNGQGGSAITVPVIVQKSCGCGTHGCGSVVHLAVLGNQLDLILGVLSNLNDSIIL